MKNLLLASLLLLLPGCRNQSEPYIKIGDESAKKVITDYFEAISDRDSAGLKSLSTPDYLLYEDGLVWNNDSLIRAIDAMPGAVIEYELAAFDFEADCNGSFVHYRNHGKVTLNDTTHLDFTWVESAYVKKVDGLLKLDFLHSSPAK